jgi:curved DNA-binding protein CbpA
MAVPVYYAMLGVPIDAADEEIDRAFQVRIGPCARAAREGDRLAAHRYRALLEAYAVLGDPARRALYDASLPHVGAAPSPVPVSDDQPASAESSTSDVEHPAAAAPTRWHRLAGRTRRSLAWSAAALLIAVGAALGAGSLRPTPRPIEAKSQVPVSRPATVSRAVETAILASFYVYVPGHRAANGVVRGGRQGIGYFDSEVTGALTDDPSPPARRGTLLPGSAYSDTSTVHASDHANPPVTLESTPEMSDATVPGDAVSPPTPSHPAALQGLAPAAPRRAGPVATRSKPTACSPDGTCGPSPP